MTRIANALAIIERNLPWEGTLAVVAALEGSSDE